MTAIALLSAHPAAALPVTGADLILYVVVAAIVGVTGLLVRWTSARENLSTIKLPADKELQ
jgi:hypothetical protein